VTGVLNPEARGVALDQVVVTSAQMRDIEARLFAAGMPVAALMEKVGGLISQRLQALYPLAEYPQVLILVGPGHNGADALVVARQLHFQGYRVVIQHPFSRVKDLTAAHLAFAQHLGIEVVQDSAMTAPVWNICIDGLFGFGLERPLTPELVTLVEQINQTQAQTQAPVVCIDVPSGLHTDSGLPLGAAIQAQHTLCLGLWKLGLLQEHALQFVGQVELLDFDIPLADVQAVIGLQPTYQRLTHAYVCCRLPLTRPASTHKYQQGHLLLVGGSRRYGGSIVLAGLAARATGVGMLTIAIPASLQMLLLTHLPDAVIVACPETDEGAIAELPVDISKYDAIACGPGLTTEVSSVLQRLWECQQPLIVDADGLNLLAQLGAMAMLQSRQSRSAPTILTPHAGEFQRLFPEFPLTPEQRLASVEAAATQTGAIVLLKGARVAIATPTGQVWINPESTPALARGGSGDVLTGLIGGLLAQAQQRQTAAQTAALDAVLAATWWHAQAGRYGAEQNTIMGVDAFSLCQMLLPTLKQRMGAEG
jgi:ADP-dependent NAD(P)H-hydrate dehydratase / NAD(P)H-hydrate epimerase